MRHRARSDVRAGVCVVTGKEGGAGCVLGDRVRNVASANRTGFVYPREENIVTICREIR